MKNTIDDFTDAELAGMVRRSIYAKNTQFGPSKSRSLLVLAVPYGPEDRGDHIAGALRGPQDLIGDDTDVQVFDSGACQEFFSATLAEVEANEDKDEEEEEEKDDAAVAAWLDEGQTRKEC